MAKYFLIGLIIPIFMLENSFALVKYGDAFVKRGTMTIIREGRTVKYKKDYKTPVEVLKNDVLRVGRKSYVKLKTVQQTTVFMGSNAVFQVRPWKQKKEQGYLRMLFGRAKFVAAKIRSRRRRFSLKTAMAVIGVKGTQWEQSTASNGVTDTKVSEGIVRVTPPQGPYINVSIGQRSFAISQSRTSEPIETSEQQPLQAEEGEGSEPDNLDAPPPTSQASTKIEGEQMYVDAGRVEKSELEKGKQESVDINESLEDVKPRSSQDSSGLKEEKGSDEEDEDFQKDLKESEDEEIIETEPGAALTTVTENLEKSEPQPFDIVPERSGFSASSLADEAGQQNLEQIGTIKTKFEK